MSSIFYPVVPKDRLVYVYKFQFGHTKRHLDRLIAAFIKLGREMNVIGDAT